MHSQYLLQAAGRAQWDLRLHARWHCRMMTEAVEGSCRFRHLPREVAVAGIDTMVCETYSPVRKWLVEEGAVEVEGAGTAHKRADSCCLLDSGLPAQAVEVEVEVHIGHTLLYRTVDNIHLRRAHKKGHSAAAGAVDTDRIQ